LSSGGRASSLSGSGLPIQYQNWSGKKKDGKIEKDKQEGGKKKGKSKKKTTYKNK